MCWHLRLSIKFRLALQIVPLPSVQNAGALTLIGVEELLGKLQFAVDELLMAADSNNLLDDFVDAIEEANLVQQIQQFANNQKYKCGSIPMSPAG